MSNYLFNLRRNLIKQAENDATAKTNHISFENNYLAFHFTKSKGDQEGNHVGLWHVF